MPGVRHVGLTYLLPLMGGGSDCIARSGERAIPASSATADPGYLPAMGIPLLAGRNFTTRDGPQAPPVAIVNETLAGRLWPGESPVGNVVMAGCDKPTAVEIVGVARDSAVRTLGGPSQPQFYRPFAQNYTGLANFLIEATSGSVAGTETIRKALLQSGPGLRIFAVRPLREHVEQSYWQSRWEARLLSAFGILALGLAAVGLHGVAAYHVTLRSREIGIRMALGGDAKDMFRMVLADGLKLTIPGVALGLAGAAAASRLVAGFLHGVSGTDALTYAAAAAILMGVSLGACWLPGRRAAKLEPVNALRHE
jgi:predicted permease